MVLGFVLINCERGSEEAITIALNHIQEVKRIDPVFSPYELVVKVKANTLEEFHTVIKWKITKIEKTISSLTLVCKDGQSYVN